MPKFTWKTIWIWFGKETVRWTAVSASTWFPKINMSFDEKINTIIDEASIWTIVDAVWHSIVKKYAEWEVTGNLNVNAISLPLYSMLGTVSSAVDTGTAYLHTFSLSNSNQSPSLTILTDDPVQDYKFPLAIINKLTIKIEPEKYVEVSMNFISKKWETATNTVAYTQDYSLKASNTILKFASNLAGLDSASATWCIKNFEITLERTTTEDTCISSVEPADFISTVFAISWSFEVTYENTTDYKDVALAGSTKAMRLTIEDVNTIIWWATSSPSIEIDLAKVWFTEWGKNNWTNEIVTQTVWFKWFYSVVDTQAISVKLVNTLSSI